MAKSGKLEISYDKRDDTLSILFGDRKKEAYCTELDDLVIALKDKRGKVIGYDIICFSELAKNGSGKILI